MSPKNSQKTPQDNVQQEAHASPFDQISVVEEREEARVQQGLSAMEEELRETERALRQSEEKQELQWKEAARAEIKDVASKEPAEILTASMREAQKEIDDIESAFRKHGDTVAKKLVTSVVDFTFHSSR